jgi:hypothetical protein
MPATAAKKISRILEDYRTRDGRHVFLWGASSQAPGVAYSGPTHKTQKGNDTMHFAVARGISTKDLLAVRKEMGIRLDGTSR